jgi:predicted regulator of Ras-like GTPase activity (Roadblock/LC7/MglB family)
MAKISIQKAGEIIKPSLDSTLESYQAIDGLVVVTVDGHMIISQVRDGKPTKRLATMGSSLMSLGDTVAAELGMDKCKNVIVENEGGYVVFRHINKVFVLAAITNTPNGLGILLSASKACAENISKAMPLS